MSFSRQLKMPEKRNLHNKTRLFYYQYIPPFRFIANNFIKICHKCSKFQNSWKIVTKIYQFFFLQNQFFNENLLFWSHINIFWEAKKKLKIFYVIIFFQKIAISKGLFTLLTDITLCTQWHFFWANQHQICWKYSHRHGSTFVCIEILILWPIFPWKCYLP